MDKTTNKTSTTGKGTSKSNEKGMSRTEFAEEYSVDTGRKTNTTDKKTSRPNKCN